MARIPSFGNAGTPFGGPRSRRSILNRPQTEYFLRCFFSLSVSLSYRICGTFCWVFHRQWSAPIVAFPAICVDFRSEAAIGKTGLGYRKGTVPIETVPCRCWNVIRIQNVLLQGYRNVGNYLMYRSRYANTVYCSVVQIASGRNFSKNSSAGIGLPILNPCSRSQPSCFKRSIWLSVSMPSATQVIPRS